MAKKRTYRELEKKIATLEKGAARDKRIEKARQKEGDPDHLFFFENSPIAQAEIDCSRLKRYFDELRENGVTDFYAFFQENKAALQEGLNRIKLIRTNKSSHKLFHTTGNNEHGEKWTQYVMEEEGLDNFRKGMAAMAEGRTELQGESLYRLANGEKLYVYTNWRAAPGHEKTLSKVHTCLTDITKQKRVEDALAKSQEHLANAQAVAHLGSWEWDVATKDIVASDEVYRILGLAPQSMQLTMAFLETLLHPDDRNLIAEVTKCAVRDNSPYQCELRFRRPDGSKRRVLVRGTTYRDKTGWATKILGTWLDITHIVYALNALGAQGKVLEDMAEGVNVADEEGLIVYTNPAFDRMFGYQPGELTGQPLSILNALPPDENTRLVAETKKTVKAHGQWRGEFSNIKKDGTLITTFARISALQTDDKIHFISVQEDITERKRLEKALRESERELRNKAERLEETNVVLNLLLEKRDTDRNEFENAMVQNVKELVLPYLQKLKGNGLDAKQKTYVHILERNLDDIMSPFLHGMSLGSLKFTPAELQIINLLKEGLSTKQMAGFFDLSPRTVESYRDNIREKLGLKNTKMNLRSYLMTKG